MKRILQSFQFIVILSLIFSYQAFGQNYNTVSSIVHATKFELKILNNIHENDIAKMNDVFRSYPGKIIRYMYGENKNKVFVFISDTVDPIDILQVLKMNGIVACFRDSDNGYVSLEPDGQSTRKLYFKE